MHRFPAQGNGYIGINFGNQCSGETYDGPGGKPGNDHLLKNCNIQGMAESINDCQHTWGKKILLSLGGGVLEYSLNGVDEGIETADQLWEMFGPKREGYMGPRPLDGSTWNVDLDGFDFDIEAPASDGSEGYIALALRLREHFNTAPNKQYYLTTAPQCIVPDANVGDLIKAIDFDLILLQFYNTGYCSAKAWTAANPNFRAGEVPNPSRFAFDEWSEWLTSTASKNAKILLGLPGSPEGANPAHYLHVDEMERITSAFYCRPSWGGIFIWDATHAYNNQENGFGYYENAKRALAKAHNDPLAKKCAGSPQGFEAYVLNLMHEKWLL